METEQKLPAWLFHSTENLRNLILENPELPIVVLATEDAYSDEFMGSTVCSRVSCRIEDVLSPSVVSDERIFIGKDEYRDYVMERNPVFQSEHSGDTDEEYREAVDYEMSLVENDWRKAIVITVGN